MGYLSDLQYVEDLLNDISELSLDHKEIANDLLLELEGAKYNDAGLRQLQTAASYYYQEMMELGIPEVYEAIMGLDWDY